MNRTLPLPLIILTLLIVGCTGFIYGTARDAATPTIDGTRTGAGPVEPLAAEDAAEAASDPLGEASDALVGATLMLSRTAEESGLATCTRWDSALDIWFNDVDYWLSGADGQMFEHSDQGNAWTRRNRADRLLELEGRTRRLRGSYQRLLVEFRRASAERTPDLVIESMPSVQEALDRIGQAIGMAESAVDTLADRCGVR